MAKGYRNSITTSNIKRLGNWEGAIQFLDRAGYEVKKKVLQAQYQYCKRLKDIVIDHLINQDLNWEPLSDNYVKHKTQNKDSILIHTEKYLENIKVWRNSSQVFVGVKKNLYYKNGTQSIAIDKVANWLEHGTSKMPARPLWGPSIKELGGEKGLKAFVADRIYRRLIWLNKGKPFNITKKDITDRVTRTW